MTRRFRLDSCDGPEALHLGCLAGKITRRGERAERLMLHWWRLGFDPAMALRCPECRAQKWYTPDPEFPQLKRWGGSCPTCSGRGWSMPHERGTCGK